MVRTWLRRRIFAVAPLKSSSEICRSGTFTFGSRAEYTYRLSTSLSRCRSLARSRSAIGSWWSPSCSVPTRPPLSAVTDELATSWLVTPAALARSESTANCTVKLSVPQVSRSRSAFGCARRMPCSLAARPRSTPMSSPATRIAIGMPTAGPLSISCTSTRAPAMRRDSSACSGFTTCAVSCLSLRRMISCA